MSRIKQYLPILGWLPGYDRSLLKGDLYGGITVGIMLIPQGMAYAMIAGLPPVYGLYASIVPQIIYAVFGTSRPLSVAPVAMDSLLVATGVSVLATEGTEAYIGFAILLAFFMGLFQLLLGIMRMGFITNLLSKPVISGFTSAAAIIIGLNQLKYLIGADIVKSHRAIDVLGSTFQHLDETHLLTLIIGIGGIVVIKGAKKIHQSLPGALIAVILGILIVYTLRWQEAGVAIVQNIPEGLPSFQIPNFSLGKLAELIPLALTISVVAFMEAYSVAKAIESQRKDHKIVANQELIALGAANLVGSLFQSYPVTGGFSRSAVNHQAGANTPLASVISAGLIALILLFLTPLFYFLPLAILASVIMVAVSSLVDWRYAVKLWKHHKPEFALLLITFGATLHFSMVAGIVTGVVSAILLLLYKAAYPHIAVLGRLPGQQAFRNVKRFEGLETWHNKIILRVDAPMTFINVQYLKDFIEQELTKSSNCDSVLLDASAISYMDASAEAGLTSLIQSLKERQIRFEIASVVGPVRDALFRTGLIEEIGTSNVFLTLDEAIESSNGKSSRTSAQSEALQYGELTTT